MLTTQCYYSSIRLRGYCDVIGRYALGLVVFGWVGDRVGHKRLLVVGLSLSGVAVAAIGLAGL